MARSGGSMETVKEFFDAIKGQLSERLANPFTGAFCIAWVIWNFRLLMVFVSEGTYQEKFSYIDTSLYLDWRYWAVRGVVLPTVTAVAYLWAYPRATRWLAEDYRKQQTRANNLMKAAEGAALLSIEDSRALRLRYAEAEQQWNSHRDQLAKEVEAQRETVADLLRRREEALQETARLRALVESSTIHGQTSLDSANTRHRGTGNSALSNELENARFRLAPSAANSLPAQVGNEQYTRPQLQVLSLLREGSRHGVADLASSINLPVFDVQRALDRLQALNLVIATGDEKWRITEAGRSVLGAFVDSNRWSFAAEGL